MLTHISTGLLNMPSKLKDEFSFFYAEYNITTEQINLLATDSSSIKSAQCH